MLSKIDKQVTDIKSAHEFAKSCSLIIAVYGKFMRSVGLLPLTYESISRDFFPGYPYWFSLKLYPEFNFLDKKCEKLF